MVGVLMLLAVTPVGTPAEPVLEPRRAVPPIVRFVSAAETTTGSKCLTFEVAIGDQPVRCLGYRDFSDLSPLKKRICPLWGAQGHRAGEWETLADNSSRCGHSFGFIELPAKATVSFDIELPDEPWDEARVSVPFRLADNTSTWQTTRFTRRQVENAIRATKTASVQGRGDRARGDRAPDR
jgi:hypothetical protein